jgi:molybdate transport repressor ModE-like protein
MEVSHHSPGISPPAQVVLRPRIKVWMQSPTGFGFGSRFVAILEAVDRSGSIKHAAAEVGWSYRHVWSRIKRAEAALGVALVATQVGGPAKERSELTPDARQIVARFHEVRTRLLALASQDSEFANP